MFYDIRDPACRRLIVDNVIDTVNQGSKFQEKPSFPFGNTSPEIGFPKQLQDFQKCANNYNCNGYRKTTSFNGSFYFVHKL